MGSTVNRIEVNALVDRLEAGTAYLTFDALARAFGFDFVSLVLCTWESRTAPPPALADIARALQDLAAVAIRK